MLLFAKRGKRPRHRISVATWIKRVGKDSLYSLSRRLGKIEQLDFSVRTMNCLRREGIATVGELVKHTESDLMAIPNFGRKCLQEVKHKLASMGLNLRSEEES